MRVLLTREFRWLHISTQKALLFANKKTQSLNSETTPNHEFCCAELLEYILLGGLLRTF